MVMDMELDWKEKRNKEGNIFVTCDFIDHKINDYSCLNDTELDFLGASWPKYCESATRNGMQIIRLPMIEGGCPNSIEEIDAVIEAVNVKIRQGENVLAHCRGGREQQNIQQFK